MTSVGAAFNIAWTGLDAALRRQANTAHSVANVSTNGFRTVEVFQSSHAVGGQGVRTGYRLNDSDTGPLIQTGSGLDTAIGGGGFFLVQDDAGNRFLTREGSFRPDGDGVLRNALGYALVAGDRSDALGTVTVSGTVSVAADGAITDSAETGEVTAGAIKLATVPGPSHLSVAPGGALQKTAHSGDINLSSPGASGTGALVDGALEASPVQLDKEVTNTAFNRATFSANVATVKTAMRMLDAVLDIKA